MCPGKTRKGKKNNSGLPYVVILETPHLLVGVSSNNKLLNIRGAYLMGYFRILAAIPGFFLSSLIFMLLWGVIAPDLGLDKINYPMSMLITITLWLTVAPLAAVGARRRR